MTSWDGTQLFYRVWQPPVPTEKALLLFHRGHEHSGRFHDLVSRLGLDDTWVFAWDARGHGRSPGERGYAESFGCLVRDVDAFVRHVHAGHGIAPENMVVLAHSVGAVVVSAWVHDFAPPVRALILATPALRVKLYVPFALPGLRLLQAVKGKAFIKSYVRPRMLTHDSEQAQLYRDDPLIARDIAVNILLGLHDASTRLMADAGAIRVPTLLLAAGSDWVVRLSAQKTFFERLGSPVKEMEVYPGFHHALFHETDRDRPIARAREFITRAFERPAAPEPLLRADAHGYTKDEYDRLRTPLSPGSPRRLGYAVTRLALGTLGRLSRGIRLGWQTGFDSGESLDHVYDNTPRGVSPLGRWFDRLYLDSPGWRGIRQRKVHLAALLRRAMEQLHTDGRPVRVVDVACGPGRYLLETIRSVPDVPVTAVLRDRSPRCLEAGRELASRMNVAGVRYEPGDAFDPQSLASVDPRPTLAVVSGLYELFPENEPVRRSLDGLWDALEDEGFLVYTNQPWHPQIEFIARVLPNRDGRPWVMRRRTQAEMDDLVRATGFEKLATEVDEMGIFTVSLARKAARSSVSRPREAVGAAAREEKISPR
jgi:alpha-beta hydrolase superfamily lysophospholipase/SAM-dependent methyltransferase